MTFRGKKDSEITPEEIAQLEKETKEEYEKCKELLKKKPSWMIDETSTLGESLEFHAITVPFKWQQLIEIEEQAAQNLSEFAKIFDNRPDQKEHWLKRADESRRHAEEMRLKWRMIRATADTAQKEIDKLI